MFTYQQDWIMRQIQIFVDIFARTIFKKSTVEYQIADYDNLSQTDILFNEIERLLSLGEICNAEDMLFDQLQADNQEYLLLAIDFYKKINMLNDEELEKANFSRDEINSGLMEIIKIYGLPEIPV